LKTDLGDSIVTQADTQLLQKLVHEDVISKKAAQFLLACIAARLNLIFISKSDEKAIQLVEALQAVLPARRNYQKIQFWDGMPQRKSSFVGIYLGAANQDLRQQLQKNFPSSVLINLKDSKVSQISINLAGRSVSIFSRASKDSPLEATGIRPDFIDKLRALGINISPSLFETETTPRPEPTAKPTSSGEFPDFDRMSPEELMGWMESLAVRQGATQGLTTSGDMDVEEVSPNDERLSGKGDYVPYGWTEEKWQEHLAKEEKAKREKRDSSIGREELAGLEAAVPELNLEEAEAWLDNLASGGGIMGGEKEELASLEDEIEDLDWLTSAEPEGLESEMPDWLKDGLSDEDLDDYFDELDDFGISAELKSKMELGKASPEEIEEFFRHAFGKAGEREDDEYDFGLAEQVDDFDFDDDFGDDFDFDDEEEAEALPSIEAEIPDWLRESMAEQEEDLVPLPRQAIAPSPPKPIQALSEADSLSEAYFTAYYPRHAAAKTEYGFYVYAHLLDALIESDIQAFSSHLGGRVPKAMLARRSVKLDEGTLLTVMIHSDKLQFNPMGAMQVWKAPFVRFDFKFTADESLVDEIVEGRIAILLGMIEIASIDFKISVGESNPIAAMNALPEKPSLSLPASESMPPYQKIFVSYSRKDTIVAEHYRTAQTMLGNTIFMDVHSIRAGEDWDAALKRFITDADVFQLFWSEHSATSDHCRFEWEFALSQRCPDTRCRQFIRPTYWQKPMPIVPEELNHLHFAFVEVSFPESKTGDSD
jgi:hypothetical protein